MIQQPQRAPRDLIGRIARIRVWRGTPNDLMAIAQRIRALMAPRREKALERRRAEIEEFYDKQIAEARRTQPADKLGAAIDVLQRAKEEDRARAVANASALAAYEEFFSVTLENNVIVVREAERLFTEAEFPQGVKAVNMTIRAGGTSQITVALARANPIFPQLDVYVSADDPTWMEGSVSSMREVLQRSQPLILMHWRWWVQPNLIPIFAWAFLSWFFAVLAQYYKVPILASYPWLAIFIAALPAAGVFALLQRAIPPFAVSRTGQETSADLTIGIVVTIIGAVVVAILGNVGVWLASQTR